MTQYIADLAGVCGCQWGVTGSSPEEIVQKTVKHAGDAHHMKEVPPEIAQKLKAAIRPSM
jgi:predicted small metal-binding protein